MASVRASGGKISMNFGQHRPRGASRHDLETSGAQLRAARLAATRSEPIETAILQGK